MGVKSPRMTRETSLADLFLALPTSVKWLFRADSRRFFVRQDVLVNPFMADAYPMQGKRARDLLRAVVKAQSLFNSKPTLWRYSVFPFTGLPFPAFGLRLSVAIATSPFVAGKLTAYRRNIAAYLLCRCPHRLSAFQSLAKVIAFFSSKVRVVHKPFICAG